MIRSKPKASSLGRGSQEQCIVLGTSCISRTSPKIRNRFRCSLHRALSVSSAWAGSWGHGVGRGGFSWLGARGWAHQPWRGRGGGCAVPRHPGTRWLNAGFSALSGSAVSLPSPQLCPPVSLGSVGIFQSPPWPLSHLNTAFWQVPASSPRRIHRPPHHRVSYPRPHPGDLQSWGAGAQVLSPPALRHRRPCIPGHVQGPGSIWLC